MRLGAVVTLALCALVIAGCSEAQSGAPVDASSRAGTTSTAARSPSGTSTSARAQPSAVIPPAPPPLVVSVPAFFGGGWHDVARVHGAVAAWVAQRGGTTFMRFDQSLTRLALH